MKPYYLPGTVFERSPDYYTQQIVTRNSRNCRSSSPYESPSKKQQPQIQLHPPLNQISEEKALREQNLRLKQQLHTVLVSNMPKYRHLLQQNQTIRQLETKVQANNSRIRQLESIRAEVEERIHNVIAVDRKINQILSSAQHGNNNRLYLKASKQALLRGEDRETVSIILRNIIM